MPRKPDTAAVLPAAGKKIVFGEDDTFSDLDDEEFTRPTGAGASDEESDDSDDAPEAVGMGVQKEAERRENEKADA
jgi:hypothetical protein